MAWCFGLFMDMTVKVSTLVLTSFMLSESWNFKSILGNFFAVWFLDQLDEMTASFILAQIDVFAPEVKKQDNFMKTKESK